MVRGAAIVDTGELACTLDRKLHVVLSVGDDVAILVLNAHGDIGQVALTRELGAIHRSLELGSGTGGGYALAAIPILGRDDVAALVIGLGGDDAIGIRNVPAEPEILGHVAALALALIDLVGVTSGSGLLGEHLLAQRLRSRGALRRKEELDASRVGVDNDLDLAAAVLLDHIALPSRKNMQCVQVVVPLALVQIVRILGKASGIDDTEVGILRRDAPIATLNAGTNAVPWSGLAQIVKASPDILAGDKVAGDGVVPCLRSGVAPAYARRIVGGQLMSASVIILTAANEFVVDTAAVNGRNRLGTVELPRRINAMQLIIHAATGIVNADQTAGVGKVTGLIVN